MFGFLKDKLKQAISKFTKDVKEEVDEKPAEPEEEKPPKKEDKKKEAHKKIEKPKISEKKKEEVKQETKKPETKHAAKEEKKHEVIARKEPEKPKVAEQKKTEEKHEPKKPEIKHVKKEVIEEKKHHKSHETTIRREEPKVLEQKTGFFGKIFGAKKEEPVVLEKKKSPEVIVKAEESKEEKAEVIGGEKGFFEKLAEVVTKKTLSESKFEELFFELEVTLLENNVAVEVIEKIKEDLKNTLLSEKVSRMKTELVVAESLKKSIDELFDIQGIDIVKEAKKKKPYVICFVGVNGSGKTTNLAKVASYLKKKGLSPVIAACDTFRAAAIQQIEEHARNLDIKLVKHDYGADAAAVAFDAIQHAKAQGKDVVLIDTAGRSHANVNLMEELQKVVRVSKPDLNIFVGDSLTGNDAVEQAKTFNEKVGIDGIILSKVDVDEKGGASVSVSYVTKKPILFIGTGQTYDDLEEFDKDRIIKNLGL